MKADGMHVDIDTYVKLSRQLSKRHMLTEAVELYELMMDGPYKPSQQDGPVLLCKGCVLDLKTWTMLIQGHCAAGDVDKALQHLTKMIEKNLEADADLLDVMVKGLCSHGKVDAAYTLFVEMVDKAQFSPWQGTYKHIIGELLRVKKLEEALSLLRSMKARKFPPFADPFPPHIAKYGTFEDAREFLKALTVNNYPSHTAYLHGLKSFFAERR